MTYKSVLIETVGLSFGMVVAKFIYDKYKSGKEPESYFNSIFLTDKGLRGKGIGDLDKLMTATKPLVDFVETAEATLDICFYVITAYNVVESIINMKKKGVKVRVVVDYNTGLVNNEYARKFFKEGIPVYAMKLDQNASIMHHKFIIRDNNTILEASMNLTQNTAKGSFDNIMITNEKAIVEPFIEHFESLIEKIKSNRTSLDNNVKSEQN